MSLLPGDQTTFEAFETSVYLVPKSVQISFSPIVILGYPTSRRTDPSVNRIEGAVFPNRARDTGSKISTEKVSDHTP